MKIKAILEGYHSLTPDLVVKDVAEAIEFYKKVFGAQKRRVFHEGFAPPAESVARMMKFNEELAKEEAVKWAKRVPAEDGDMIEIRQVFEVSDFPLDVQKAVNSPSVKTRVEKRK